MIEYVGVELANLGAELQLVGVDDGAEIELFPSIDEAVSAYRTHSGVEKMMRELGRRRSRFDYQLGLVRTLSDLTPSFYERLGSHIDAFLDHFISAGDDRTVGALLELWEQRRNIPEPPPDRIPGVSEVYALTQRVETEHLRNLRAYLAGVIRMLLWYAELLRAIDGLPSGIASSNG